MMNHPINSGNDDMFILSPQVDYNGRPPAGGLVTNYANTNTNTNTNNNNAPSGSSYSVYPPQDQQQQQQQNRTGNSRMYYTEELLDDARDIKEVNNNESNTPTNSSFYGHNKSILPGTNSLSSPTSSEAGKSSSAFHLPPSRVSGEYDSTSSITSTNTTTTTAERRQSLVMSGTGNTSRVSSPRHHPYMSPGKVYTPSIMSTLQSYRQSDYNKEDRSELETTAATNDLNRHPW
ncbi:uncharacterized protein EV154DRAFT_530512 [Mucor mucedo]|uniref:uncharacterized protein n=1 Tax=Mucor mucedo TaxID=29922 RepID=UPI00221F26D3|nr:uncharacterized protein EV154DRAFT_530512 [Mucor mucedo]KAI7869800.1 hypothetical protein EV154DRAFT_530512 [Mucor mucedo]